MLETESEGDEAEGVESLLLLIPPGILESWLLGFFLQRLPDPDIAAINKIAKTEQQ